MENIKKETKNKRILFLVAVMIIGFAYFVSGQVNIVKEWVTDFRGEPSLIYDSNKFMCIGIRTLIDGELIESDSIEIFIQEKGSKVGFGYTCREKTKIMLPYDKVYDIAVTTKKHCVLTLMVNTTAPKIKYAERVSLNLLKCDGLKIVDNGLIEYSTTEKGIRYYPAL